MQCVSVKTLSLNFPFVPVPKNVDYEEIVLSKR